MDSLLRYTWLVGFCGFIITIVCMFTNNRLVSLLISTTGYLNNIVKPDLMRNDKSKEARFVTTHQIPLLNIWYNEQLNYGLINIVGVLVTSVFLVYGGILHKLPYIIICLSTLFVSANIIFLPKAVARLFKVIDVLSNYILLIALLETKHKTRDHNDDNVGKQSST
jgi:hypothetical protein